MVLQAHMTHVVVKLSKKALGKLPVVTLAVLGFTVYLHAFPATPLNKTCVSFQYVYWNKEWHRLFLAPLHHADNRHLYFNTVSFLWKGLRLEQRLGAARFLCLLLVFSLLTGLVHVLLQLLMTRLTEFNDVFKGFIDLSSHSSECAVGFSGVLLALKVVNNTGSVTGLASWVELVVIYLITPRTSLVAHLAGVLVGLVFSAGPLKISVKIPTGRMTVNFPSIFSEKKRS